MILGLPPTFALFIAFGFMVGVFFGFFGMGGSFLVTLALCSSAIRRRSRSANSPIGFRYRRSIDSASLLIGSALFVCTAILYHGTLAIREGDGSAIC